MSIVGEEKINLIDRISERFKKIEGMKFESEDFLFDSGW
jgi:hypothetical protein